MNMGKILAIDYGKKRTGLAETDDTQTFAFGLQTVDTQQLFGFLDQYFSANKTDKVVVGEPKRLNNEASESAAMITEFVARFRKKYPQVEVIRMDERFTSKMAFQTMIDGGLSRSKRRDKALIDKISATIILQSYLESVK